MTTEETYMYRCLQLAELGAGNVAPNPMVGAVLVYGERIIGEGYHRQYGQAHAEVNCINSVSVVDKELIPLSTLYVSLEPCAHYGKTPPCADLIIQHQIKKVVVGCRDPFKQVDGKGIEKLQNAGIDITAGVLEEQCKKLNKRFFTFHTQQRPYIILKWAQTANEKIASTTNERLFITNEFTNRLVHKWRGEEAGILVGTNTALLDDPELTNRLWNGNNPIRLILDKHLRLPVSLKIFNGQQSTIIFNLIKHIEDENRCYYQLAEGVSIVQQVLSACYKKNIQSILIEGGATLLQSFIDEGIWDEARVITNTSLYTDQGLSAPKLSKCELEYTQHVATDQVTIFHNTSSF
ncbi:MAG: bifunctional diaminohydroxyphosphoribosylaminopyrimidine deaminase/5-amino-6-(5-phosphoribosylamino)uracil reductase RibD [Panacibacter sp.]